MTDLKPKNDLLILALIICLAIIVRVFTIWIGRPEFVGWFSHSYYYFIEVQGILKNGSLVYPDMPLLFHIYAFISKLLIFFGIETKLAIVTSTRFVMSITPALLTLPIFFLIKSIDKGKNLTKLQWLLVLISAFLPLSITHMPVILQKNMFGLLLFGALQFSLYQLIKTYQNWKLLCVIVLTLLILLTHLGTLAATFLLFVALLMAYLINYGISKNNLILLFLISTISSLSLAFIYFIDISRFNRIVYYFGRSFSNSQIGLIYSSETALEKLQFLGAILFSALITYLLYRIYKLKQQELSETDNIFWLTNIIFIYLLLFPVLDLDLLVRFILFISVPIIIILIYFLKYLKKQWVKNIFVGLFVLVSLTTTFGEIMSAIMRNGNNRLIQQEIISLKNKNIFKPNDFVITKYSVNPICNWFFETKSGLITSLNKSDFNKYRKVFIFNPKMGFISNETINNLTNQTIKTESQKYEVIRNNVLIPKDAVEILTTESIEIHELSSIPTDWKFDSKGNWIGYSKE